MSEQPCKPGWHQKSLIQLAEYHNGAAFNQTQWGKDGLPIIRIEQMTNPQAKCDLFSGALLPNNRIDDGDLIFSWSATLKVLLWDRGPGALNQHLFKVIPRPDTDLSFLKHLIDFNLERLGGSSQGSTMKHVTRKELTRHQVCVPRTLEEQRRVALVLDTIDGQIGKTEALIAKHQQIKAGLMHDLFSPGGQVVPLGDVVHPGANICYGIVQPGSHADAGIPMVAIWSLNGDYSELHRVARDIESQYVRSRAQGGDVILSIKGTIGRVDVLPDGFSGNISRDVARIRPSSEFTPWFLKYWLEHAQDQLLRIVVGSTRMELSIGRLKLMPVPKPSRPQQDAIVEKLAPMYGSIQKGVEHLKKLEEIKLGLACALLSGGKATDTGCLGQ